MGSALFGSTAQFSNVLEFGQYATKSDAAAGAATLIYVEIPDGNSPHNLRF